MQTTATLPLPRPTGRHPRLLLLSCLLLCLAPPRLGAQSDPLDQWTSHSVAYGSDGVAYGDGQFVAVGGGTILASTDGANWTLRAEIYGAPLLEDVAYGNGLWVAVGTWMNLRPTGAVLTSTDGATWTSSSVPVLLSGVAYANGQFLAVGAGALTSTDGASWTVPNPGLQGGLNGICYGNGQFVGVGPSGAILTSSDGANWTGRYSGTANRLQRVAYGNGQFVAVGWYGTILTSTDGATWTTRNSGTTLDLLGIAYHDGQFVAVGGYGAIVTSSDGANWTGRNSGLPQNETNTLTGVAYGNGMFVAVGFGPVLTSGTVTATPEVRLAPGPAPVWGANGMSLALDGPVGSNYVIQASSDLANWTPIESFSISNSPFCFHAAAATNAPARFYRALLQ
ncbi:MAG TPA: hypothetical protein VN829_25040 [Dongiaceae bacterium]|nr:hypothetical protein [Dongiaceae bacterium]